MSRIPDGQYLKGLSDVSERVGQLIAKQSDITMEGMQEIVTDVRQRAVELAPVESGTLRGTAYDTVAGHFDQVIGSIHFPEPYAARQHEHMEYNHPQGGEAKFLEKAMLEKAENMREQLAAEFQKLFGGG